MKKAPISIFVVFLLFLSFSTILTAQSENPVHVQWPIEQVTVYQNGAWIERTGNVQVDSSGRTRLTIAGLTQKVDDASLQVTLPENWALAGASFRRRVHPDTLRLCDQALKSMASERGEFMRTRDLRSALLAVYEEELAMIVANRKVGGDELLLVEDLKELADFWRDRVKELQYLMLEIRMEQTEIDRALEVLRQQRLKWEARKSKRQVQIWIDLVAQPGSRGSVRVGYVATNANWQPGYDAQVSNKGSVNLMRHAVVVQNTGTDWNGIPLLFAAGNPLSTLAPPRFESLLLTWNNRKAEGRMSVSGSRPAPASYMESEDGSVQMPNADQRASQTLDRFEFTPLTPVRISGHGIPERVALESLELEGSLLHLVLPMFSDESYQVVASAEWESARLMEGAVQVMAGGVYRGSFQLQLPAPGDTLEFPLGQDGNIRCHRERLLDRCSNAVFGLTKRSIQTYELTVVNHHSRPVHVRMLDRVPISSHDDIKVSVLELSGGVLDPNTGEVEWGLDLDVGQQITVQLSYEVQHPKRVHVRGW